MIDKLTDEQIASFPQYVKKWIDIAVHRPTRDIDTVTNNVRWIYDQLGYDSDEISVQIIDSLDQWIEITESQVESQVRSQVWSQVWSQVRSQVWSQVESQVRSQVRSQVWSQVRSQVWSQVESQVRSQVWSQVESQVRSQVESQVWYRADDIAYGDFMYSQGFIKDNAELFYKWADVISDAGMAIYTENTCYLLAKPKILLDTVGNNHSDREKAIKWGDNSGMYYLHGVRFEENLWQRVTSRTMPFADILAIKDIDQRKQAMKYGSVWDFVKHCNAKEIDTYIKVGSNGRQIRYWLYKFPATTDMFPNGAMYAIYDDSMLGAAEQHMQGVPKECRTVAEAMGWKQYITAVEWEALELDKHFT